MPKRQTTDITQTPAFQRWFAGSKVVDAAGHPLRVYHGTTSHFQHFSHEDIPYRGGILAFFSTSTQFASDYATGSGTEFYSGANVIPCYLRIIKPFDFRREAWLANEFWEETGGIVDKYDRNRILMGIGHDVELDADGTEDMLTQEQFFELIKQGSWDALESEDFVHWLREYDHDGIITLENNAVNYAIFEPNQVKSAIGSKFTNKPGISEQTVRPIRAYHGTPDTFSYFDISRSGGSGYERGLMFFTDNPNYAESYGRIRAVDLYISNPYEISHDIRQDNFRGVPLPHILKKMGYDAIFIPADKDYGETDQEERGNNLYIPLDSRQIKNA